MFPQARSYCARFLERMSRPSLSSRVTTTASIFSPMETMSAGLTPLRIDNSRAGMTPSDLYPISKRASSLSTRTTVPSTNWPASTSTIVAE